MIIDAHCHIGRSGPVYPGFQYLAEEAVTELKRTGIAKACCFSFWDNVDNDYVAAATRNHPELIGFAVADPKQPGEADRLERYLRDGQFKGVKLHPQYHGYALNNPIVHPIFEVCQGHGAPILCHGYADNPFTMPGLFADMADRFPRVNLIMAHSGYMWGMWDSVEMSKDRPNLYLGTTCISPGAIRAGINRVGAEKYIFEVDQPWWDIEVELLKIRRGVEREADQDLILGANMRRLLKLG